MNLQCSRGIYTCYLRALKQMSHQLILEGLGRELTILAIAVAVPPPSQTSLADEAG